MFRIKSGFHHYKRVFCGLQAFFAVFRAVFAVFGGFFTIYSRVFIDNGIYNG